LSGYWTTDAAPDGRREPGGGGWVIPARDANLSTSRTGHYALTTTLIVE
jgi:hypothetical protein